MATPIQLVPSNRTATYRSISTCLGTWAAVCFRASVFRNPGERQTWASRRNPACYALDLDLTLRRTRLQLAPNDDRTRRETRPCSFFSKGTTSTYSSGPERPGNSGYGLAGTNTIRSQTLHTPSKADEKRKLFAALVDIESTQLFVILPSSHVSCHLVFLTISSYRRATRCLSLDKEKRKKKVKNYP